MYSLAVMLVSLIVLVVVLRLKVRIGRAMALCAVLLAVLLGVTPAGLGEALVDEWHSRPLTQTTGYMFVTLTALLTLVNFLGAAMGLVGISDRLLPALHGLFRSRRVALAVIPMLMGMLPTPGGIMLSAPLVRDSGDRIGVERSRLAAINFFFRHLWEPIWPMFPALPFIQGLLGVSAFSIIAYNLPLTIAGMLSGTVFLLLGGFPKKDPGEKAPRQFQRHTADFLHAFWPIALAITLYACFNLPPAGGVGIGLIIFLYFHKVPPGRAWGLLKKAAEPDFALLILGALLFKLNLQAAGAVGDVAGFLTSINLSEKVLIFMLPFMVSFLTGLTLATAAITFPFLVGFIGTGSEANLALEALAFCGIICGFLLTPIHLCLALSVSYFETSFGKIIVKLLLPTICVAAAGVLTALLFS